MPRKKIEDMSPAERRRKLDNTLGKVWAPTESQKKSVERLAAMVNADLEAEHGSAWVEKHGYKIGWKTTPVYLSELLSMGPMPMNDLWKMENTYVGDSKYVHKWVRPEQETS